MAAKRPTLIRGRKSRIDRGGRLILMLVDAERYDEDDPFFERLSNIAEMEHHVAEGLRRMSYEVHAFPISGKNSADLVSELERRKPLLVFNLVQHLYWDRLRSADIPALLELLGIPCTGCGSFSMPLALDKAASKLIVTNVGLSVPRFAVVPLGRDVPKLHLCFPVIVKPRIGGASLGISLSSVAHNRRQLEVRVHHVHRRYNQAAICEEFIVGREFSVGLIEDSGTPVALPVRETFFGRSAEGGPSFATETLKNSALYRARWNVSYGKALVDSELEVRIQAFAIAAYRALGLKGYSRVDLRYTCDDRLYLLEANPNPDVTPEFFGIMADWGRLNYTDLLAKIMLSALESCGAPR